MEKNCIQFHFPKYLKSSIIVLISSSLNETLFRYIETKLNPLYYQLISFIGQTLAIIPYFIEKKRTLKDDNINLKKKSNIFVFILICSICDLIGKIGFTDLFNYDEENISFSFINIINMCSLFFFIFLLEYSFLKIPIYRHHFFGIGLNIFGMIIALIIQFNYSIDNKFVFFIALFFSLDTRYLITLSYIISKKLNTKYFISMNYFCFMRGLIGIFISIIIIIINFYIKIIKIENEIDKFNIWMIALFCLNCFILNIYTLKIIEESRPCYILIPELLSQFINNLLIHSLFQLISKKKGFKKKSSPNKKGKNFWSKFIKKSKTDYKTEIISFLFSFIGVLIFSEVATISFCNLNKFTKSSISNRAKIETVLDISQVESDQELETNPN